MITAIEAMDKIKELDEIETPGMALLRICRATATLVHHPDVAPALAGRSVEKILEHLRQQRTYFSSLTSDARNSWKQRDVIHARAACAVLSDYEERMRRFV